MTIHDFEQRSEAWFTAKRGKFSGSKFGKLFASKSTDTYQQVINKIVFEIISGTNVQEYESPSMRRGTELEPEAREAYQERTFNLVKEVGLIELNEFVAVSPDGLIGEDGGLEIKCLEYNNLIKFLTTQKIPRDYEYQMQGCMWVTGRKWWDYFVYHPDVYTEPLTVLRDEEKIDKLKTEVDLAINEVKQRLEQLNVR